MSEPTPAPVPAPGPTSVAQVLAFYGPTFTNGAPADALPDTVGAVNRYVERRLPAAELADDDVRLGATMLAGRVFKRRLTPNGMVEIPGGDGVAYVAKTDPQVSAMLRLRRPRAG